MIMRANSRRWPCGWPDLGVDRILSRYPKVVRDCIEEVPETVNGVEIPVNTSEPNPNGIEFDNLYLASPWSPCLQP